MAEIPALFAQRPIFQRQTRVAQYYAFVEALAMTLWYLAAKKGISGKVIDRYRDAAEFAW